MKIWPLTVIAVITILAYQNSFSVPLQFDDHVHFGFIESGVYQMDSLWRTTRWLSTWTLMAQYSVHGRSVFPYHVFNLVIHILNAFLVYFLTYQLLKKTSRADTNLIILTAVSAGLIFAVHPLQTQAVTYIVQRVSSLVTLFFLLANNLFFFYNVNSAKLSAKKMVLLSGAVLMAGVAAAISKENGMVLPAVLLLQVLVFFPSRLRARNLLNPILLIAMLLLICIGIIVSRRTLSEYPAKLRITPLGEQLTHYSYGLTQLAVLPRYLGQIVLPLSQNIDHVVPVVSTFGSRSLIGVFVIACLLVLMWISRKRQPMIAFGIGWFFITMLVESSVFYINDVYVEHRMYLPIIGFLLSLASLSTTLLLTKKNGAKYFALAVCVLVITLSIATYRRNIVWQSEKSLWSDAAQKAPHNPRAHYNLAIEELHSNNPSAAAASLLSAIDADPKFHRAYNNLGAMMFQSGEYGLAVKYFMMALSFDVTKELYDKNLSTAIEYLDSPDSTAPPPRMADAMYQ